MEPNSTLVVFLCIFLVFSGAVAIVSALKRLGSPSSGMADSAFETKFFKWSAPAGLVYGVVAIMLVIGIIKFWSYPVKEQLAESNKNFPIRTALSATKSVSVLNGKLLISYDHRISGPSELRFQGVIGVSSSFAGPFKEISKFVKAGEQIFVQLHDNSIWGINILDERGDMDIEVFPTSLPQVDTNSSSMQKQQGTSKEASKI